MTFARIFGCSAQKYSYVPGRENVCANVSSFPVPAEVKAPVREAIGCVARAGLGNDETFAQTFSRPGTYEYFCGLHPKMRAKVIVK